MLYFGSFSNTHQFKRCVYFPLRFYTINLLNIYILKGKKIPSAKKNVDAQQFIDRQSACEYVDKTRAAFDYFLKPYQPKLLNLYPLVQNSFQTPANNIVFILLCKPQTIFDKTSSTNQDKSYEKLAEKRKQYKIPTQAIFSFNENNNEVRYSIHQGTIWFSSDQLIVSN